MFCSVLFCFCLLLYSVNSTNQRVWYLLHFVRPKINNDNKFALHFISVCLKTPKSKVQYITCIFAQVSFRNVNIVYIISLDRAEFLFLVFFSFVCKYSFYAVCFVSSTCIYTAYILPGGKPLHLSTIVFEETFVLTLVCSTKLSRCTQ